MKTVFKKQDLSLTSRSFRFLSDKIHFTISTQLDNLKKQFLITNLKDLLHIKNTTRILDIAPLNIRRNHMTCDIHDILQNNFVIKNHKMMELAYTLVVKIQQSHYK